MKLKATISLVLTFVLCQLVQAQVWFPEGVFMSSPPSLITVDNQVTTISKLGTDVNNSYWQVSVNDGKLWVKLPKLTLSKTAEITDIVKYQGFIYVSGNFTFDNGAYNALVRYNPLNFQWQGIAQFQKTSQPSSITVLDVQNNQLILGGNFVNIINGGNSDTISYLAKFNGVKFNHYFDACKNCNPDNAVIDIASNDTVVAISGTFTSIGKHKSKYLVRISYGKNFDTFMSTPRIMEKLALDGNVIYSTAGALKDKRIFKVSNTFTEVNYNLDSSLYINEILILDGRLIANGAFHILSASADRMSIVALENNKWVDISNNYRNANYIATGRSALFAIGNPELPISVWNPNKFVVRFYPGLSLVKVKVFLDTNNNCIREKGEKPVAKQFVRLPLLNRGVFTNENGMAEFLVPNNIQNTLKFAIRPLRNHVRSNCADTTVTKTFIPGVFYDSIQFPVVKLQNVNDIRVILSSPKGTQVIKNKGVTYYLTYENVGSNAISGKIQLKKNPLFSNEKTDPPASAINSSTYEWTYSNLAPGEKKTLVYTGFANDTNFSKDQQFQAMASSSISTGSSTYTDDDFDSIPQEVNSTINPFRKDVFPTPALGDSITYLSVTDRDLRYHISFNNFTTDTVFYAVVIDTLDLNLDMSYIQETGSNKSYYTEVQTDPNNQYKGILIWHFPNIKLTPNPTMNFEVLSSGAYIGFKVNSKPLTDGYMLKNVASVFYDNVYAGSTNAVYCSLAISGIDELNRLEDGFQLYPNPFNRDITLACDFKAGDVIQVYNVHGQLVYHHTLDDSSKEEVVNLIDFNSGVYFIRIFSEGKLIQRKCLKL